MQLTVIPLLAERMENEFNIFEELENTLVKNETKLQEGDVIVISTKYISNSQGRIVDLEKIKASEYGMNCLLYTSPSPRDGLLSRMPSSA